MSKISFNVKEKKPVRNDIWAIVVTWATGASVCGWFGTVIDGGTGANTSPTTPETHKT